MTNYKGNTLTDRQARKFMTKGITKPARKLSDNETPFKHIKIAQFDIKLIWSKNQGVYGHQVTAIIFGKYTKEGFECYSFKTGGYGYCKESSALSHCFAQIGIKPKGWTEGSNNLRDYAKGGNFYKVPNSKIRRA